jgi:hypothetical protein
MAVPTEFTTGRGDQAGLAATRANHPRTVSCSEANTQGCGVATPKTYAMTGAAPPWRSTCAGLSGRRCPTCYTDTAGLEAIAAVAIHLRRYRWAQPAARDSVQRHIESTGQRTGPPRVAAMREMTLTASSSCLLVLSTHPFPG